jgi:hypothetical protein
MVIGRNVALSRSASRLLDLGGSRGGTQLYRAPALMAPPLVQPYQSTPESMIPK